MVAKCRSRLAVRPHSSRAVLFYSQHPDGSPDHASLHGGCPVISKEKWAGKFDNLGFNYRLNKLTQMMNLLQTQQISGFGMQ